jgi:hypothetical protein
VTGSGVTSTILPIIIVPALLLFAWLGTVMYMGSHRAQRRREQEAAWGAVRASRGAAAAADAGPAGRGEREATGGRDPGRQRRGLAGEPAPVRHR